MKTRERHLLGLLTVGLAVLAIAPGAHAQGAGFKTARPYVMLLMDTSGSMEWRAATFAAGEDRLPVCDDARRVYQKSRWITSVEVMTGSFQDYRCRLTSRVGDEIGYYIPHVSPLYSKQLADGILDFYDEDIEFGLMTMDSNPSPLTDRDGMYSYPDGTYPVLADRHSTRVVAGQSVQGILWTKLRNPACQYFWNLGARRAQTALEDIAGAMIPHSWVPAGGGAIHRMRNAAVQSELLGVSPYWSSPVAALLADTRYYFANDPAVIKRVVVGGRGDCFYNCRDRHVILITDGIPNQDGRPECRFAVAGSPPAEGVCPYRQAWEEAFALYSAGINVHVIGFSAVDSDAEVLDAAGNVVGVVDELERMGRWGWGGRTENCPTNEKGVPQCVLYADNAAELQAALSRVLGEVLDGAASRTKTATVNTVVADKMGQRQFFSSMDVTATAWEGNLERVTYKCQKNAGGAWETVREADVFDYGDEGLDKLVIPANNFTIRRLYSSDPSGSIQPAGAVRAPAVFVALDGIDAAELGAPDGTQRTRVLNWMHGTTGSGRETARLGAIYHTSPVIVGSPGLELPLVSYNVGPHRSAGQTYSVDRQIGFRQLYARRPDVLYVATMDGILHAFDVSATAGVGNPEMWGYVPPMLLGSMYRQLSGQMYLLDGSIAVRDLRLFKNTATNIDDWATVLVMGLRMGGGVRGYFALDVTAPYMNTALVPTPAQGARDASLGLPAAPPYGRPTLLWQITSGTNATPLAPETLQNYSGLGLTYARPAFGNAVITEGATTGETAIVVLSAGVRPEGATREVGCGLYIVRASDGRLIRWLTPPHANCTVVGGNPTCTYDPAERDCQIVGTPLPLGSLPGDITTRIFVGDSQGRLYRADLSDPNPARWELDPFFSLFDDAERNRQPIFEAPAAAIDHRGLVTLVFGSGNPDDLENRPLNRMASITEMFNMGTATSTGGLTCHLTWGQVAGRRDWGAEEFVLPRGCTDRNSRVYPWINWVLELDADSTPDRANLRGPADGPMAPFITGERLLGTPVIFNEVAYFSTFVPSSSTIDCCTPGHGRILGVHYVGSSDPLNATDTTDVFINPQNAAQSIEIDEMEEGEIAFGVSIVRRPSCMQVAADDIPDFAQSSRAEYRLVVHNNTDPDDLGPPPPGSPERPQTGFLELSLQTPPLQCYPDTWLSILGL
jgi:type IV pilus assembly protein PilY1